MSWSKEGPVGGPGGISFDNYTVPQGYRISEVHVMTNQYVHGIQFQVADDNGGGRSLPVIGNQGGTGVNNYNFVLAKDEYITGISGQFGWYIDCLRIHTNKRVSPLYGGHGGDNSFELSVPEGNQVVGLFGSCDWYLDSLGIITDVRRKTADLKGLQIVEGIGPKIASILVAQGIMDLADLAQTSLAQLETILSGAGSRYRLADPTTWAEQAQLGAEEKWADLETLQAKLKGGRRTK